MTSTNGQQEIVLDRGNDTSVRVNLHGSTVVSWLYLGSELLFVSEKAVYDNKKAIRGGIPVVFPNFGPWDLGPQHGFARTSTWTIEEQPSKLPNGDVWAVLSLEDNEQTREQWNYKFQLKYLLTLKENSFHMDFKVINCDDKSFSFTCLLHTYIGVPDVRKCKISGLQGLTYVDKVAAGEKFSEAREQVTISENVDRVYEKTPAYWEHLVTAVNGGYNISLQKHNMPDTVVWNPWIEKAKAMTDFGDDEYLKMLCVEAGYVSEPFTLKAGENYEGTQVLIALPASDSSL